MSDILNAIDEALIGDVPKQLRQDPRRLLDVYLAGRPPKEALQARLEADRTLAIDAIDERLAGMRSLLTRLKDERVDK